MKTGTISEFLSVSCAMALSHTIYIRYLYDILYGATHRVGRDRTVLRTASVETVRRHGFALSLHHILPPKIARSARIPKRAIVFNML